METLFPHFKSMWVILDAQGQHTLVINLQFLVNIKMLKINTFQLFCKLLFIFEHIQVKSIPWKTAIRVTTAKYPPSIHFLRH